ncbi:DHHA1 domain-containing protein, partial [Treponema sp. R6D11]
MTEDLEEAKKLVKKLIEINNFRQALVEEVYNEAKQQAEKYKNDKILVLSSEKWHIGIVGIVANKIAENFCKPTYILVEEDDGMAKGSARSYAEFDIFQSFDFVDDILVSSGGHKLAGGFSLETKNIPLLR